MICPDCKGSKTITLLTSVEPCRLCDGTGQVPKQVSNEEFFSGNIAQYVETTMTIPKREPAEGESEPFRPEGELAKLWDFHKANCPPGKLVAMKPGMTYRPEFSDVEGFWLVGVTLANSLPTKCSLCKPRKLAGASSVFTPDRTLSYEVEGKLDGVSHYWTIAADEVRAHSMSLREVVKQRIIKFRNSHSAEVRE